MKRLFQAVTAPLRLVSQPVALVVAALLLLGGWGLSVFLQLSAAEQDARSNLRLAANAVAAAVDAPVVRFAELAQTIHANEFAPAERVAATTRLLRLQSLVPGNGTTFMLGADGHLLAASTPFTPQDEAVGDTDWFRRAIVRTSILLGLQRLDRPWLGLADAVVLTRAVQDASGAPVGLVGVVLPAGSLVRLAVHGWLAPGTRIQWLGLDNVPLLTIAPRQAAPAAHASDSWATGVVLGVAHFLEGDTILSASAPLRTLDAEVVASEASITALRAYGVGGRNIAILGVWFLAIWMTCLMLAASVRQGDGGSAKTAAPAEFGIDWECTLDTQGVLTDVQGFAPVTLRSGIGEKLPVALGPAADVGVVATLAEAIHGHARIDSVILPVRTEDNQERLHRVTVEQLPDGRCRITGRDVTAEHRAVAQAEAAAAACRTAEAAAAAATREQERVLTSLGHDIRTPMTSIAGICDLLLEGELELEQRGWLERMQGSCEALLGMLNGLLEMTAGEFGRGGVQLEPVDVASLVLEVMEVLTPPARDKGLELRARCDDRLRGQWLVDPARLRQVLFNLGSNAVKFTQAGQVEIRASAIGDEAEERLRFTVSDTGPGIDPADRELIFGRFQRGRGAATAGHPGLGLGLALCRENTTLMGGTLTLESTVGIGSEFTCIIPAERVAARDRVVPFAGRTALIVADDSAVTRALAAQLGELGMVVETAPDGYLGLAMAERLDAQRGAVDLVVLQGDLPGMAGEAFLIRLHASAFGRRALVVWLGSGAATANVDATVPFPADPYQVAAVARQLLAGRPSLDVLEPNAVTQRGGRVLLVEDDRVNQSLFATALTRRGFAMFVAGNGDEAVRLASRDSFDAILMDLHMPGMDGFEATRRIRNLRGRGATIPIIALTAMQGAPLRARCLDAGFNTVLEKPVNLDRLSATLQRLIAGVPREPVAGSKPPAPDQPADVSPAFLEEMVAVVGLDRARACIAEFVADATARCMRLGELLPGWEVRAILRSCEEISGVAETCGAVGLGEVLEEIADAVTRDDRAAAEALIGRLEMATSRLPIAMAAGLEEVARRWEDGSGSGSKAA